MRRARGLACLAGPGMLAFAAAAGTVAVPAPARAVASSPVITGHAAVSWGNNWHGQLGDGTTTNRLLFVSVSGLGSGVVQVAAGVFHSLAVTSDGTAWAWGSNLDGELGTGTTTDSSVPVQVKGLTGVVAVAAGYQHSLALRSDGTVWAWGADYDGQLGDGTAAGGVRTTPVEVPGLAGVTKIAAAGNFSLALRSDGTVWAWGANKLGQLGNGTMTDSPVPVRVFGLSQVTSISAGTTSGYAIRTQSITALTSLWAWGANGSGELGDGTQTTRSTPVQVTGISAPYLAGVAAGLEFAVVVGSDGSVWGFGSNAGGQLGFAPSSSPVLRPVEAIAPGSGITQLSAGSLPGPGTQYGHVLALRSDATVLAWGSNTSGELGDGTTASHIGPEQVFGLTGATQVAAGAGFSLAVTALAAVPSVRGLTTTAAGSTLQAAGFVLGQVSTAPDYSCNYLGLVMAQTPVAGASARLGSPVAVTVGVRPPTPCP